MKQGQVVLAKGLNPITRNTKKANSYSNTWNKDETNCQWIIKPLSCGAKNMHRYETKIKLVIKENNDC